MRGNELRAKLAELQRKHRFRAIEPARLPLLPAVTTAQIITGFASTADVDSGRMSFQAGSLLWPPDLAELPLRICHTNQVAGKIIALHYDADGRLRIEARVDDLDAARMQGLSVSVTVIESETHNEDSSVGWHFVVSKGLINEISLTPIPCCPGAILISRRDVRAADEAHDDIVASLDRFRKGLAQLAAALPAEVPAPPSPPPVIEIDAAPAHIYGRLPRAMLVRSPAPFTQLVARLPTGG